MMKLSFAAGMTNVKFFVKLLRKRKGYIMIELNIFAVIVSAVIIMGLGAMWFSPVLFGNQWMKEMNLTMEDFERMQAEGKSFTMAYVSSGISALVISVAMASLISLLGFHGNIAYALLTAVLIYFCFTAMATLKEIHWEDRPLRLSMIGGGYELTSYLIAAGISALWV